MGMLAGSPSRLQSGLVSGCIDSSGVPNRSMSVLVFAGPGHRRFIVGVELVHDDAVLLDFGSAVVFRGGPTTRLMLPAPCFPSPPRFAPCSAYRCCRRSPEQRRKPNRICGALLGEEAEVQRLPRASNPRARIRFPLMGRVAIRARWSTSCPYRRRHVNPVGVGAVHRHTSRISLESVG